MSRIGAALDYFVILMAFALLACLIIGGMTLYLVVEYYRIKETESKSESSVPSSVSSSVSGEGEGDPEDPIG